MPNNLCLEISSIKLSHQGVGYIVWFYVSIQNLAVHVLDYNPFHSGDSGSSYFMYIDIYDYETELV